MAQPSHIVVVDEAGNPPLRVGGGVPNGYVACAVAIRTELRDAVIGLLPRDPDTGEPLKAVSRKTMDVGLAAFLRAFFSLDVAAGLLAVDSSDAANVVLLQEAVDFANGNRKAAQKRQLNPTGMAYWLLAPKAVLQAWAAVSLQQRTPMRQFELVFDVANTHKSHRAEFVKGMSDSFQDEKLEVQGVRWTSEQDEPLLHVPDYIAGVVLRQFTRGDCPASWAEVEQARARGQISVQEPVEIYGLPPRP